MTPYLDDGDVRLYLGQVLEVLAALPAGSVDCIVTSPPYFGLRDYGLPPATWPSGWVGQLGLEPNPGLFVEHLVAVFAALRRVLSPHGTCWMNMGDTYASKARGSDAGWEASRLSNPGTLQKAQAAALCSTGERHRGRDAGFKEKDLMLMPARCVIALQEDGWWVRSRVIWAKPNPIPESVEDRPTSAHEDVYLLTRAPRYFWDAEAVREADAGTDHPRTVLHQPEPSGGLAPPNSGIRRADGRNGLGRNMRNVWTIPTQPTPEAHFATFPRELVRRCLAAGCPTQVCRECGVPRERIVERGERSHPGSWLDHSADLAQGQRQMHASGRPAGTIRREAYQQSTPPRTVGWTDCGHDAYRPGVVLDPFVGSGTTAIVARALGLHAVGIDSSEEYLGIAQSRLASDRARRWTLPGPRPVVNEDQLSLMAGEA